MLPIQYSSILQEVMFRELRRPRGDPEVLASQSREQYFKVINCVIWDSYIIFPVLMFLPSLASKIKEVFTFPFVLLFQLKKKMQILTLGIGGVGLVSAYVSYSPEIAARYINIFKIYIYTCYYHSVCKVFKSFLLIYCSLKFSWIWYERANKETLVNWKLNVLEYNPLLIPPGQKIVSCKLVYKTSYPYLRNLLRNGEYFIRRQIHKINFFSEIWTSLHVFTSYSYS